MAAAWNRAVALSRLQHNRVLQHALPVEPRLQALIDRALQPPAPGYDHDQLYETLRAASRHPVGPQAENPQLRAPLYGEALLVALDDLLPPNDWDPAPAPTRGARVSDGGPAPVLDTLAARYYVGRLRHMGIRYGWPAVVHASHTLYTALRTEDRAAVQDALRALHEALALPLDVSAGTQAEATRVYGHLTALLGGPPGAPPPREATAGLGN